MMKWHKIGFQPLSKQKKITKKQKKTLTTTFTLKIFPIFMPSTYVEELGNNSVCCVCRTSEWQRSGTWRGFSRGSKNSTTAWLLTTNLWCSTKTPPDTIINHRNNLWEMEDFSFSIVHIYIKLFWILPVYCDFFFLNTYHMQWPPVSNEKDIDM